jgi:AcrR family transcriptional regulator
MFVMARRYESPVRAQQANRTRAALLDACESLLLEGPVEEVTLPAVARRAGVTKPTAYSYFPGNDALLAGFIDYLRGRIGMDYETLAGTAPTKLPSAAKQNYGLFEKNARLVRRIMDSPSYDRVRLARKVDRPKMAISVWADASNEPTLRERLGPIYLLISPPAWRWLRDTWGLSRDEAAEAAAWAIETLTSALAPTSSNTKNKTTPRRAAGKKE